MQDKKTLVILTPGFPKDENDSTCLPAQQNFVKALNKNFPELNVLILSFQYPYNEGEYIWNGNRVISFGGKNRGKLYRRLLWRKISKRIAQLSKENDLLGILSFWCGECALVGRRFAVKNAIPFYCWILGQDARESNTYVRKVKPLGKELIAMSDFLADEFGTNHAVRPNTVIPNGINTDEFRNGDNERTIDVLGVGSLIALKQWDIFIEVVKELAADVPNINTIICGEGEERQNLEKLIKKYSLQNNVELIGEKAHREILEVMQKTKVLLHPSSYEGFSTVCLEGLYAGAHVISFCKPMKEELDHWHIVNSKEEMISILKKLLAKKDIDHTPIIPFNMDDTARKVMKLYRL